MKMKPLTTKILRYTAIVVLLLLTLAYLSQLPDETLMQSNDINPSLHRTVAVFGGSGTAGDGILKAVLGDPGVHEVHVITRRATPRIQAAVDSGKVKMTIHMDYLDYSPLGELLENIDAVYWALGTSASNVSKEEYGVIHVDFPMEFIAEWLDVNDSKSRSFHYISGSGADAGSMMHWAREKARAEQALSERAAGTGLKVVSYRPPYIVPTREQAGIGHNFLDAVFSPVKMAVRATEIGQAMLEVTARGDEVANGAVVGSGMIRAYSDAYQDRK